MARIDDLALAIQRTVTPLRRFPAEELSGPLPLRDILPALDLLILAIFGSGDRTIGPHMEERLAFFAALGANARVVVVPEAGHWVPYEAPDAFERAIREFVPGATE